MGEVATGTSKSAVSPKFVAITQTALAQLLAADLSELDLVALMIEPVSSGEGWRAGRQTAPAEGDLGQNGGGPRSSIAPVWVAASRTRSKSMGGDGSPATAGSLARR